MEQEPIGKPVIEDPKKHLVIVIPLETEGYPRLYYRGELMYGFEMNKKIAAAFINHALAVNDSSPESKGYRG